MKSIKAFFKYIGIRVLRMILNFFNLFPIKNNRMMFYSFNGKNYSCNPKCISDRLAQEPDIEIYWAFKEPDKFQTGEKIKKVKYRSLKYYYLVKTSRVLVCNVQGFGELARRKGQVFIQTWHASNGYKKVGNYTGIARKLNLLGHQDYSYVLCGAESMVKRRIRGSMGFQGKIIKGTPRMDVLVNMNDDSIVNRIQSDLGYSPSNKLVLYAPTWRTERDGSEYNLDFNLLREALSERFGGEWTVAVRLHPNVRVRPDLSDDNVIDVTDYPDMQELLYTADVLISDYSSCIWDYSFTGRPCLLYCYDLKEYYSEKSFDLPIEQWGFPICESNNSLAETIRTFDEEKFRASMKKHHEEMGALEDGKATERVCKIILSILRKGRR